MNKKPLIVGIGGTLRRGSSTERALEMCLSEARMNGVETEFIKGVDLILPLYNPDKVERSKEAQRLIEVVSRCDGLIIGSPGYHGSISGLVKNALDYLEDLRNGERIYLDGRAVGCVACGAGAQSIGSTLTALRSIVHALRGWPTPLGVGINSAEKPFTDDGGCHDLRIENQLRTLGRQVVNFAQAFRATNCEPHRSRVIETQNFC